MATPCTEEALNSLVLDVSKKFASISLSTQLYKAAQDEVGKSSMRLADLERNVTSRLVKSGWEKKLRNVVYQHMLKVPKGQHPEASEEHRKEPVTYIRKAQMTWEKRIIKSLNSMCTELSVPLARKRGDKEQKEVLMKWTELGTDEPDLSQFRPLYAPKDFLEVISHLRNPNLTDGSDTAMNSCLWGVVQVPLSVKDIHQLRLQFSEMSIAQCQSGVDDQRDSPSEQFTVDRMKLTNKVINAAHSPLAQEFCKKGCPVTSRAQLWCQMLAVTVDDVDVLYYEQLKHSVLQYELLVDSLIYKDVKMTATNDDQYFVFEDYLYQVLMPFSRDTSVLEHFRSSSATPAKSYIRGKLGQEEFSVLYPPNGVIPFHGYSMYVAPLCYVYNDPILLYYVFRELYTRFFYRLHTLSSHPQGIVSLCLLFESLLQTHEPQLFYHLKAVGVQPLRIAFKWLVRAFSGYLSSEQVLLLWDRILAYNSLEILPVLAMSIFSFRKTNLMQVHSFSAADSVMADLTLLQIIPLIQLTLFSE